MPDISEQALNEVTKLGIESQLDEVKNLTVDIHTDPGKLIQGNVESVEIAGEGLVMKKALRADTLIIKTNDIKINPLKAVTGDIELEHPVNADTGVVLTEEDISKAFNSEYIQSKLSSLTIQVDGQSTHIKPQQIRFEVPENDKIRIQSNIELLDLNSTRHVEIIATPKMSPDGHQIQLEDIQHGEGTESPELVEALVNASKELLDLRNFELDGMTLKFQKLDVRPGKITIKSQTKIDKMPS